MIRGYVPDGQGVGGYSVSGGVALSTLVTGLVAYWSLDETSGTRADSVGTADLTDTNTVGYDTGKNGNGAKFVEANSEYLDVASFTFPATYSLAGWAYATDISAVTGLLQCETGWPNPVQLALYYENATTLRALASDATNYTLVDFAITADAWHHFFVQFDGSSKKLGLSVDNGTLLLSTALSGTPDRTASTLYFGYPPSGSEKLNGVMDEVAIWSRVLTEDERAELYNSGTGKFFNGTNFV